MYRVTTEIHFAYGHRLMNYDGKCAHPHGHNARVEVELATEELDAADIATDFTVLKHAIQDWIDEHVDHKMVLRRDDPLLPVLIEMNEPVYVMDRNPTAECLAELIYDIAAEHHFPVAAVRFWESPTSFATYTPSRAPYTGALTEEDQDD
ncbi:MAG TPA: 6-carboxytetrahydropterin synthase [Chloroflexota bacterium]|nr:6-carboxytetrahydropterin synthase [Chloroflexota bacterium]